MNRKDSGIKPYILPCIIILSILISVMLSGCDGNGDSGNAKRLKKSGDSCLNVCDYVHSMDFYIDAVKEADRCGDTQTRTAATCNIGIIHATFKDNARAEFYFRKALEMAEKTGDKRIAGICVTNLILLSSASKDNDFFMKLLELKKKYPLQDNTYEQYWNHYSEAIRLLHRGETASARDNLKKAFDIAKAANLEPEHSVMTLVDTGTSWLKDNRADSAICYYNLALELGGIYPQQKREIYKRLTGIYSKSGDTDSLLKYQTLLLQLNDSVYDSESFNVTKNSLTAYEDEISEHRINEANWRFITMAAITAALAALLLIIYLTHRKLRNTYMVLWDKNNSLLQEIEYSRKWKEKCYFLEAQQQKEKQEFEITKTSMTTSADTSEEGMSDIPSDENKNTTGSDKLDPATRQRLDMEIMELIHDKGILYDPNLTINTVSSMLNVNSKYVSLAISETYGMNFRSFINRQRLDEACRRLADNEKYGKLTIAAIAADCGFKSTNNFIVIFKKFVGMTPLRYRNISKENDSRKQEGQVSCHSSDES